MGLRNRLKMKPWHLAAAIGLLYAAFGACWILLSDALVVAISPDSAWLVAAHRYKGLFYIALTAGALVLLVHAGYAALQRSQEAARANELQVQDLFMHHPQPMWVVDRDSLAFLDVNEAAVHHYGYSRDEFLRMTLADIRMPSEVAQMQAPTGQGEEGYRQVGIVRHRRKNGDLVDMRITGHRVPFAGRLAVIAMAVDVTQEVQAQNALVRQQAQYRQLHQSLAEVLWLATPDGSHLLYVSPAFDSLYGRPAADFERDTALWLACVHPDDRAVAAASATELKALGHCSCEYRIRRPDGSVRWVADRKRMIVDEEGRPAMIGGIAEDITAAKERDAERESARAELEVRVRERTAELERVNAELDAFTRTAAHDLRSPLNAVAGFSHLLRSRHAPALGEGGVRMLTQIETSARQMSTLITDLLLLSRLSTVELAPRPVDLAALAREIVQELRQQEPAREVAFEAPEQLLVHCDPGLARPLLANLLGNAWKFTGKRADARIELGQRTLDERPQVFVQDNGAGFDATATERLFQPFQRFHTASEFDGTGVGLATCRRIVERHGGQIGVQSAPGAGATFHFTLPLAPAAEPQPQAAVQACT